MADEGTPSEPVHGLALGLRTQWCGELRVEHVGQPVALCGWVARRREHGEHLAFVDVRDRSGVVQCVVDEAVDVRSEWVVRITGVVRQRPEGTANPALDTGEIEVGDCQVEVLNRATPPPFPLDERRGVDETTRLRHRYVDLRRDRLQRNLRARGAVNAAIRRSMERQGFTEIETPLLIPSTPEGARDFVVPSRLHPGRVYALPQSPQIFKQLCMVGGVDRYYQIARCLRDEDLRADRQFEFTQLDLEASFVGQEEILAFVTDAVRAATSAVTGVEVAEVPRMSWHEAMERYGSDKPDVRFGMELVDLTDVFADTGFRAFAGQVVKGIRVPGGGDAPRNRLDELTDMAKRWGAKGLVWMRVRDDALDSPVAKFLSEGEMTGLRGALGAEPGDLLLLVADERSVVRHVLGLLRLELRPPPADDGLSFLWVVDFPLFEGLGDDKRPVPAHHPFTAPHPDDVELLAVESNEPADLLRVRSQAYDLVVNGVELGSGSVRIHRPEVQRTVFSALGITDEAAEARFGFLLEALRYGAPPHAGFALGIDRFVAQLVGEDTIREVIAFPKTQSGSDPLTEAPLPIDAPHLAELGLRLLPPRT